MMMAWNNISSDKTMMMGDDRSDLVIGRDVLDLGSHRRTNMVPGFSPEALCDHMTALNLGRPGQFDLPNVPDVREI